MIYATRESFGDGIKHWYGKDNTSLADIIFNYLGRGKINHKIRFSEFINFTMDFTLSE